MQWVIQKLIKEHKVGGQGGGGNLGGVMSQSRDEYDQHTLYETLKELINTF